MDIHFQMLKQTFLLSLESLYEFEFTFFNPLFWAIVLILFLVLRRIWGKKNSFTFSSLTAIILLVTTELENNIAVAMAIHGEPFDSGIIRMLSIVIILVLFLAYVFLRAE
jgi:hypothetical protein